MIDLLGWLGNFGFLFGAIWLARKLIAGFYAQAIANLFYIAQSILLHNSSLLCLSVMLCLFNIYGIYKWSKKES